MRKSVIACLSLALMLVLSPDFSSAQGPEIIKLPAPQTEGGKPLMQALKLRQSTRGNFGPAVKLSDQVLSNLLWAADGVNRPDGKRTAPSAVDWQNIQIYVTTPDGLFLYDAPQHALRVIAKKDVRAVAGMQDFVKTAPLNLIYVADMSKTKGMKWEGENPGLTWSFAGVGAIAQNVYLFCASEGLACILRAMADSKAIAQELKLGPDQKFLLAQTVAQFK
ncbi:MAG: SagB/ThcOx family dehydrogenase [Acidobacteria bacterium]|mgnify:FL=1|nr:SagB/ThcOx family dehydrogenase [Acidobacteriota bacterium]